jgi:hypothetical protein
MNEALRTTARRISGYEPLHGSTMRGGFALGVGVVLLLITASLCWVAWGDLPPSIDRPTVPPNVFAAFAFCFFGATGLFLTCVGVLDLRRAALAARQREIFPHEPWRWDYAWNDRTARDISLRQAAQGALGLTLGLGVIAPLNYVVLYKVDSSFRIFPLCIVGLFDLLLLISLGTVVYRIAAQVVHGRAKLRLADFPLRLGERAELSLAPLAGLRNAQELQCTLRCVEEQCEARRGPNTRPDAGRTTTVNKIGIEHFCAARTLAGDELRPDESLTVAFDLPGDATLQTRLSGTAPLYWELVLEAKRPGIDLYKRLLLPVY